MELSSLRDMWSIAPDLYSWRCTRWCMWCASGVQAKRLAESSLAPLCICQSLRRHRAEQEQAWLDNVCCSSSCARRWLATPRRTTNATGHHPPLTARYVRVPISASALAGSLRAVLVQSPHRVRGSEANKHRVRAWAAHCGRPPFIYGLGLARTSRARQKATLVLCGRWDESLEQRRLCGLNVPPAHRDVALDTHWRHSTPRQPSKAAWERGQARVPGWGSLPCSSPRECSSSSRVQLCMRSKRRSGTSARGPVAVAVAQGAMPPSPPPAGAASLMLADGTCHRPA
ncbi:hypothetical protein OH77DRAFT_1176982 [Trametes cingulata]|nr:hypothetical protein OH77DRAFT_1176982 [Trametes cingulata]